MRRSFPDLKVPSPEAGQTERFYERMDEVMRELWGEHLHHGLWREGDDDHEAAARSLVSEVGGRLDLAPGACVLDVGCGYGATGVQLGEEFGYEVEGVTLSGVQKARAVSGARVIVGDWLAGVGESDSMDGVIAIESLEHMTDMEMAVGHLARMLRPGGRTVLACWVRVENPTWLERVLWLDPIRQAGQLWGQGSEERLLGVLRRTGFTQIDRADLSSQVAPTWWRCARRAVGLARSRPGVYRRLGWKESLKLGLATVRIVSAYQLGLLRYVVVAGVR